MPLFWSENGLQSVVSPPYMLLLRCLQCYLLHELFSGHDGKKTPLDAFGKEDDYASIGKPGLLPCIICFRLGFGFCLYISITRGHICILGLRCSWHPFLKILHDAGVEDTGLIL